MQALWATLPLDSAALACAASLRAEARGEPLDDAARRLNARVRAMAADCRARTVEVWETFEENTLTLAGEEVARQARATHQEAQVPLPPLPPALSTFDHPTAVHRDAT